MIVHLVQYLTYDMQEIIGIFDSEMLALEAKEVFLKTYEFTNEHYVFITPIEVNKHQECFF